GGALRSRSDRRRARGARRRGSAAQIRERRALRHRWRQPHSRLRLRPHRRSRRARAAGPRRCRRGRVRSLRRPYRYRADRRRAGRASPGAREPESRLSLGDRSTRQLSHRSARLTRARTGASFSTMMQSRRRGGEPGAARPETNRQILGMLSVAVGVSVFAVQDVIVKGFSGLYPVHQIVVIRSLVALPLLLVATMAEQGGGRLRLHRLPLHLVRGIFLYLSYTFYYLALARL